MISKIKSLAVYSVGLVAGIFLGKWAAKIAGDMMGFLDSLGGPAYLTSRVMIPTNLLGVVEALVTVIVLAAVVGAIGNRWQ
ncbi:MAG: hypothetical protein RRB13_08360 [bacterium]|nr:hypothetical protein [bacterium]